MSGRAALKVRLAAVEKAFSILCSCDVHSIDTGSGAVSPHVADWLSEPQPPESQAEATAAQADASRLASEVATLQEKLAIACEEASTAEVRPCTGLATLAIHLACRQVSAAT